MYVPRLTQNNLSFYVPKLKIRKNMYNYHDFYIKSQNYDVYIGCIGRYVVTGMWMIWGQGRTLWAVTNGYANLRERARRYTGVRA